MKKTLTLALSLFISVSLFAGKKSLDFKSSYVEVMTTKMQTKDVVKDFGMKSDPTQDQSAKLQKAIDAVAKAGGGKLIIPKGTYCFVDVYMKSNVHILVSKDAVLKPYWGDKDKVAMLYFSVDEKRITKDPSAPRFIENCSLRGLDGEYTVEYSDVDIKAARWGIRFIIAGNVKNFYIADFIAKDNFTTYCAATFVPSKIKGSLDWEVNRPTQGEMRNCSIYDAHPGYGLVQLHGSRDVYFEDLYAQGGVTLRLETGANTPYIGVYDIKARNIVSENGRSALMMGPHIAQNGTVTVDGLKSISSSFALTVGKGFVVGKHTNDPDAKVGRFSDDCAIHNIEAIYGTHAQVKGQVAYMFDPEQYKELSYDNRQPDNLKWLVGPSIAAVYNHLEGVYNVDLKNIKASGFPKYKDAMIYSEDFVELEKQKWEILGALPTEVPKSNLPKKTKATTSERPKPEGIEAAKAKTKDKSEKTKTEKTKTEKSKKEKAKAEKAKK